MLRSPRPQNRLLALLTIVGALLPTLASPEILRNHLWVTNGSVRGIALGDNVIYLGGTFTRVGPATGGAVAIDVATGAAAQPYPLVAGTVQAVAPDGSGGWFIGGSFSTANGQPRSNLAHIDAAGSVTAWNPGTNFQVDALAVEAGTVYVGGLFTTIGGQPRNYLAAVNASTGAVLGWAPQPNGEVLALALSGGTLYLGGAFTSVGVQARNRGAAVDVATGSPTSWDPNADGTIYTILAHGGTIYAGGSFLNIGAQPRSRVAALNNANGAATTWNPGANGTVHVLGIHERESFPFTVTIYAGGRFTSIGGQARTYFAALDASSNVAAALDVGIAAVNDGRVAAISVIPGMVNPDRIYAGGLFNTVGGLERNNLFALDAAGAVASWDPEPNKAVHALDVVGSTAFAGGEFTSVGGVKRNNLAALDASGGMAIPWDPDANGSVTQLILTGTTLYVSGAFTSSAGQARGRLAAIDTHTGAPMSWNPDANDYVHTIHYTGSTIYAGGWFTQVGGQPRNYLAAIDPTTGLASSWNPSPNSLVTTIGSFFRISFPFTSTVYVGGLFTSVGVTARNHLAAIDAVTGVATAWNPNPDGGINDIVVRATLNSVTAVYAAGAFNNIGGAPRFFIAEIDPTGVATAWNPGSNGSIDVLRLLGSTLYAGGGFTSIGGQSRNHLAALDVTSNIATAWDPNASSFVYVVEKKGGTMYAGGPFTNVSGAPHSHFVGISDGVVTSAETESVVSRPHTLRAAPNPFEVSTELRFALLEPGEADVGVYDVAGRLVRRLHRGLLDAGEQRLVWDGRDSMGRETASGLYLFRVRARELLLTSKALRRR